MAMPQHQHDEQTERDNAVLVRGYWDTVWNRGDLEAVERFFGDEFTNIGHRGADARVLLRQIVATWRAAFPDLHFAVDEEIVRGDAVVHRVTCSGTHTGLFKHPAVGTLPPTGRTFAVDQMHIHHVQAGRIVAHWATRNDLKMLQQLGAVASPEAPHDISAPPGWQP
jgi:predicted ester cyclase